MAIDTAEKRRGLSGISRRMLMPMVTPNAAKDADWRSQVGRNYFLTGGGPVIPGASVFLPIARRRGKR